MELLEREVGKAARAGWLQSDGGLGEPPRDFYVRQLWDWKLSVDVARLRVEGLSLYAELCGSALARAHARSGTSAAIAAYLGQGHVFDRALVAFAGAYADQKRDHQTLVDAVADGRLQAVSNL